MSYIDTKVKCRHLKKFTCKGTFRQVFICLKPPPPLQTVYVQVLIHTGKGGGGRVELERRLEGQQVTKLGRKYQHDWMYLQSINSDKHLPQSPFTGKFLDDILLLGFYSIYLISRWLQPKTYKSVSKPNGLQWKSAAFIILLTFINDIGEKSESLCTNRFNKIFYWSCGWKLHAAEVLLMIND